ncbi:hypothetical protein B0H13DRAFT_2279666, partial [Mycena leptocephala]
MADIVGLVASVLQLVDTVAKARDYIHDFRNARKDQKKLLQEIQNLQPLITELNQRIKDLPAGGSTMALQKFKNPLSQLQGTMKQLAKKLEPTGTSRKVSNRLTWSLWGKDEVNEGLNTIERSKNFITPLLVAFRAHLRQEIDPRQAPHTVQSVETFSRNQMQYHTDIISAVKDAAEEQGTSRIDLTKLVE